MKKVTIICIIMQKAASRQGYEPYVTIYSPS
jgi:hypothetical protein